MTNMINADEVILYFCATDNSMINERIYEGDTLLINQSLPLYLDGVFLIEINGEKLLRRVESVNGGYNLYSDLTPQGAFHEHIELLGVVQTNVIHY